MPLHPGTSRAVFSENVSEMMHAGHPQDQSVAAAYREKRMSRAPGGPVPGLGGALGALAMPGQGLGRIGQLTSPQAAPGIASGAMPRMPGPGLKGLGHGMGFADGGDPGDDMPYQGSQPHAEFLARHGIETASPDLSPTATGADIKAEGLGMVDPLGATSAAAGYLSPSLGEKLESIKEASPEGYGAGQMISPATDVAGNLIGKGIGMVGKAAAAAPKTAKGIAAAGTLAAGTAAAGEQPTSDDEELNKRLSVLGDRPSLSKDQQGQIDALNQKITDESKAQATLSRRIKPYKDEKDADYQARVNANPNVKTHADNIATLRQNIKDIGGQVLANQTKWDADSNKIHTDFAQELADRQKAGEPLQEAHPGAVLAARAGALGLSGIMGTVGGWKHLPFWHAPALGALAGGLGAVIPSGYDVMQGEGTRAHEQAMKNFRDPNFYERVGIDTGIGAAEGALTHGMGHVAGAKSRRNLPEAPELPPAAPTPGISGAAPPSAPAPSAGISAPARTQKQWPQNLSDVDWDHRSDGVPYERGTGHPLPRHLRDQIPQGGGPGQLDVNHADGGAVDGFAMGGNPMSQPFARTAERNLAHTGPVIGSTLGRGDSKSITVPGGSYVLPASHVSSLGQGNTLAGHSILKSMFSGAPFGTSMPKGGGGGKGPPRPPRIGGGGMGGFADGGPPGMGHNGGPPMHGDHERAPVPIMISDGEHVLSPDEVAAVDRHFGGWGDVDRGHKILDAWVVHERQKHVKELKSLPGPAKN